MRGKEQSNKFSNCVSLRFFYVVHLCVKLPYVKIIREDEISSDWILGQEDRRPRNGQKIKRQEMTVLVSWAPSVL